MMAEAFTVRVATPNDAEPIGTLLRACYPRLIPAGYPADILARALSLITSPNPALLRSGTYYLAEKPDGTFAGCGGWTFERPGAAGVPIDPKRGHIRHFATHPDCIRRGVGRALFERCVADAQPSGVRQFECYSSLVSERFYRALGFVRLEPITIALGPGITFPSIRMICSLAG